MTLTDTHPCGRTNLYFGTYPITSRKQGIHSGQINPLVPVQSRTGTHGPLVPVREARGPAGPRGGIGPGSSSTFGPGWWDEPGPMGLAPSPPPLVPVGGLNQDQRLPFSPGSCHEPGPMSFLYIPPRPRAEHSSALFFCPAVGELCGALAHLLCTQDVRWNARATLLKLSPPQARPPRSIFLNICLGLAFHHVPSPSSQPSIARADLVAGTTMVSLLFLSSF